MDSRLKKLQEKIRKLEKLVFIDELTGILNRRGFKFSAEQLFKEAWRRKFGKERRRFSIFEVAILLIDIDFFKKLNDKYGHAAGDAALRHIARLFKKRLRSFDILGRWGGEEFIILLLGADEDASFYVAESLRMLVEGTPVRLKGKSIPLTISVGVRSLKNESSLLELIEKADQALYRAKRAGRNCVKVARKRGS